MVESSYWGEVGRELDNFLTVTKIKEQIVNTSPEIISINFIDMVKYFNIGDLTQQFFDSFQEEKHFLNVLSILKGIIKDFYPSPNKNFFVQITGMRHRLGVTKIQDLNANSYDKLISLKSVIRNITDRLDKTKGLKMECRSCGDTTTIVQIEKDYYTKQSIGKVYCRSCFSKQLSIMEEIKSSIVRFKLEDPSESAEVGGRTASLYAEIQDELVAFFLKSRINVGDRVVVTGHLISNPTVKTGVAIAPYFFKILTIERDSDKGAFELTKNDELRIYEEVKNNNHFRQKLIKSFAPKIQGYEDCKTSLLIQELSGINEHIKIWDDPTIKKGKVNIILAGDSSTAKTQLSKFLLKVAPKSYFASGDQSTIAGLLGTVYQDTTIGGDWTLSAGALVLANGGTIIIDELNKLDAKEISRLNQVLSDYVVPFDKAKVNTKIYTEVKLLGILNPSGDSWDKDMTRQKILQLNLKKAFTTRMSLIFPFFEDDLSSPDEVEKALRRQQGQIIEEDIYDELFLKQFFVLAKRKKVVFDQEELIKEKMNFYNNVFQKKIKEEITDIDKADPYSKDEIPAKMRVLAESFESILSGLARFNITEKDTVSPKKEDYLLTSYLIENYYMSMFFKTQKQWWEQVGITTSGIKITKQNMVVQLMSFMKTKNEKNPDGIFSFEELWEKWKKLGGDNEVEFGDTLNKMKLNGDIYEVRPSFFKAI